MTEPYSRLSTEEEFIWIRGLHTGHTPGYEFLVPELKKILIPLYYARGIIVDISVFVEEFTAVAPEMLPPAIISLFVSALDRVGPYIGGNGIFHLG